MTGKSENATLRFPAEIRAKLKDLARHYGITASGTVRMLILRDHRSTFPGEANPQEKEAAS